MESLTYYLPSERRRSDSHSRHGRNCQAEDGFICKHCHAFVSSASFLSGVNNRNHCPYCLWSRHMDMYAAGDRLCACKSPMRPIGLTSKATGKKYGSTHGELMLIHVCTECEGLSINRIAADDVPETVFGLFEAVSEMDAPMQRRLEMEGIRVLQASEHEAVRAQLFGLVQ